MGYDNVRKHIWVAGQIGMIVEAVVGRLASKAFRVITAGHDDVVKIVKLRYFCPAESGTLLVDQAQIARKFGPEPLVTRQQWCLATVAVRATAEPGTALWAEVEGVALLTPPGDFIAASQSLDRLLGDVELRTARGTAARRRAVERWDMKVILQRLQNELCALSGEDLTREEI